jgi:hypothetical protein
MDDVWACRIVKGVPGKQPRTLREKRNLICATKGDRESENQPDYLSDLIPFQAWLSPRFPTAIISRLMGRSEQESSEKSQH